MEDLSVRVWARQGFIVKPKIILGQLAFDQPAVQKVKFGKNQLMFLDEINLLKSQTN